MEIILAAIVGSLVGGVVVALVLRRLTPQSSAGPAGPHDRTGWFGWSHRSPGDAPAPGDSPGAPVVPDSSYSRGSMSWSQPESTPLRDGPPRQVFAELPGESATNPIVLSEVTENVPRVRAARNANDRRLTEPELGDYVDVPAPRPFASAVARYGPDVAIRLKLSNGEQWSIKIPLNTSEITIGSKPGSTIVVAGAPQQVAILNEGPTAMVARLDDRESTPVVRLGTVDVGSVAVPVTASTSLLHLSGVTLDLSDLAPRSNIGWELVSRWEPYSRPVAALQSRLSLTAVHGADDRAAQPSLAIANACWSSSSARAGSWALDAAFGERGVPEGWTALVAGLFVDGVEPYIAVSVVGATQDSIAFHRSIRGGWALIEPTVEERVSGRVATARLGVADGTELSVSLRAAPPDEGEVGLVLGAEPVPMGARLAPSRSLEWE